MVAQRVHRTAGVAAVAASLAILVLAACQAPSGESPSGQPSPSQEPAVSPSASPGAVVDAATATAYDPTTPLDFQEAAAETRPNGVTVHDVSWASATGARVTAWLVVPAGDGPFAGLVYLHGSETDRDDFLDEAEAMATGGTVSLVVDAPFARTGADRRNYLGNYALPERERDMTAQAIIDVRRAYDVLTARPEVDPDRLGFVGHSWGASAGAILAAVDARPAALVLITGRPSWTGFLDTSTDDWVVSLREFTGEEQWSAYLEVMAPFDALAVADALDGERIALQYGRLDDVVTPDVATQLVDALPGATVSWYEAGHALDEVATADRVAWLTERLGLQPISAETLATVGLPDE